MIRHFPLFSCLCVVETAFARVYLRVSTLQTAFCGVFGVSIFGYARFTSAGVKKAVIVNVLV